jgi:YVTN family beta-propeller protein
VSGAVRPRAVKLPATVSVGGAPTGLAFDPATHTLYSSNQNGNSVSVINTAHCHAGDTTSCGQHVHSVSLATGASPQGIAIDTATGTVYVANIGTNTISVINTRTCNAVEFSGCGQAPASLTDPRGPIALAMDQATDTVYVADTGDNFSGKSHTVTVINGATCNGHQHTGCGQTPPTVQVGHGPDGVAVDQATHTVYVANDGTSNNAHTVSVINAATCNSTQHTGCGQIPATIQIGHGPFWIAVDQATHTAYTANNTDSTVSVINTATCNASQHTGCGQHTPAVPVGYRPYALAIDPALHTVYVINNWDDTLSAINAATCQAADTSGCGLRPPTSQVGEGPQAVVTAPATGTVYAANFVDSTVSVINAAACSATSTRGCRHQAPTAAAGPGPDAVATDGTLHTVYVANGSGNTVSVINAASCNVRRRTGCGRPAPTIHVGNNPGGIAIDQATGTIYVTNFGGNTVSVINAATCNAADTSGCGQPPATITVGTGPAGITVNQATSTVYVANEGTTSPGNTVSVINAATCNAHRHAGCGQAPATVTVGSAPLGVAANPVTNTVYVTNFGNFAGDTVSVINGATCNGTQHAGCGHAPASVTVGPAPWGLAIDQTANTIYVANNNGGDGPASLSVINGATCDGTNTTGCSTTPPAIAGIGRAPNGISFDPATHTIYTANALDATVSVVNLSSGAPGHPPSQLPKVAVGSVPEALAIDPATHTIYIADWFDGTLSLLPECPPHAGSATGSAIPAATRPGVNPVRGRSARPQG